VNDPEFITPRPAEDYGDISLSVQASRYHYCAIKPHLKAKAVGITGEQPWENIWPLRVGDSRIPLDWYDTVEVAICTKKGLANPLKVGIPWGWWLFESLNHPVAGYVSRRDLNTLRTWMRVRAFVVNLFRRGK
jgi:hypothetical protein